MRGLLSFVAAACFFAQVGLASAGFVSPTPVAPKEAVPAFERVTLSAETSARDMLKVGQRWAGLPLVTIDGQRIGVVAYIVSDNAGTVIKVVADVALDRKLGDHRIEIGGRYVVFTDLHLQLAFDEQTFRKLLTSASVN